MKREYCSKVRNHPNWPDIWSPFENCQFSPDLDYRFREVPEFRPGYFRKSPNRYSTRTVYWYEEDPGEGYVRVNVSPA